MTIEEEQKFIEETDFFEWKPNNKEIADNKNIMIKAISESILGKAIKYASERLRDDEEVALIAIDEFEENIKYISNRLRNDRDFILKIVKNNGLNLEIVNMNFKNDKEIVLAAVSNHGSAIEFASKRLQDDKDVAIAACNSFAMEAFNYISKRLQADKDVVLLAVSKEGYHINNISEKLKNDRDVVLAAVNGGASLRYINDQFKNDKELVLTAVKKDGSNLQYASEELKNDREVVLESLKYNGFNLQYASEKPKNDKELVRFAITNIGFDIYKAKRDKEASKFDDQYYEDSRGNLILIDNSSQYDKDNLREDKIGKNIMYASEELRNNKELAILAIKNGADIQDIGNSIKQNLEVRRFNKIWGIITYDRINPNYSKTFQEEFLKKYKESNDLGKEELITKFLKYGMLTDDFINNNKDLVDSNNPNVKEIIAHIESTSEYELVNKVRKFQQKQFIPPLSVLKKCPYDAISKFDRDIWFELMKNKTFSSNDESKAAILELILVLGLFEKKIYNYEDKMYDETKISNENLEKIKTENPELRDYKSRLTEVMRLIDNPTRVTPEIISKMFDGTNLNFNHYFIHREGRFLYEKIIYI
jgi:hypothetical protein